MDDYTFKSISEQAKAIEENKLSPLTLLENYLHNINNHNESDNIFSEVFNEICLKEAKESENRQKRGLRKSFLDGIPINWKDLFDIKGKACEGGSQLLTGRIAKTDATIVKNAQKAGLISLGKTHLTELAFSGLGVNPKTATPPNSSKNSLAPGGSSSGAAVATALNLCSAGIGSDTGGSIRIPAAWNDLVGFKPTHNILSLNGALQLCPSFDTAGPITRTVQDSSYLYQILKGEELYKLQESYLSEKKFIIDTTFLTSDLCPEIEISFDLTIQNIRKRGASVYEEKFDEITKAVSLASTLFPYEAYSSWKTVIEQSPEKMYPPILARFRGGIDIDQTIYDKAWQELLKLRVSFLNKMEKIDAILSPTCPILPPELIDLLDSEDYFMRCNLMSLRNTRVANLLGLTSITIPTQTKRCGLMLLAKTHHDEAILQTAKLLEKTLG